MRRGTMQIVDESSRAESSRSSSRSWRRILTQTALSIRRPIKALNLFGLRCEASDKQAIRSRDASLSLFHSLPLSLSLWGNASRLQSRRRQDVAGGQRTDKDTDTSCRYVLRFSRKGATLSEKPLGNNCVQENLQAFSSEMKKNDSCCCCCWAGRARPVTACNMAACACCRGRGREGAEACCISS